MNALFSSLGRSVRLRAATLRITLRFGLLVTIVLSACTASPSTPVTTAAPEGSGDALATSDPITADNLSAEDEAFIAELQAEGVSEGGAVFMALTEISGEPAGELSHRIVESFPTGNDAEIVVTLLPDRVGDPDAPPRIDYPDAGEDFAFSLEYFVSYDSMPADVVSAIRGGSAHTAPTGILLAGFAPLSRPVAADGDGVQVLVEGLVKAFNSHSASELLKILETRLGTGAELDNFFKSVQALLSIKDAVAMGDKHDELQRQLDALEECARNPTHPATQRTYRDDPGYRDRILERVASVREEVKANTAVMFIGLINETGSSLIEGAPWLGYVVGPLTAWSKESLDESNALLITDLKEGIASCQVGFALDLTGSNIRLRTASIGTDATADLVGQVRGCPSGDDAWTFEGATTLTYSSGLAPWHPNLLDLEGNQSPGAFTVVLSDLETAELHNQWTPPHIAVSLLTVTDALGSPTVALTLYNGFGERVGDFSLDVVAVDPDCESPTP